jgi:predicted phosphodiesterase
MAISASIPSSEGEDRVRIGLVTDIHNDAVSLSLALAALETLGVDLTITLGDTCDIFSPDAGLVEVTTLLRERRAVGVWGNHDFALCRNVDDRYLARYAGTKVLDFMAGMSPSLVIGDCHFSHLEPLGDPHDVAHLWSLEDKPLDLEELASRSFATVDHRLLFIGHYHRWWASTPGGRLDWSGDRSLELARGQRYFIVVAPVLGGYCGWLDTDAGVFLPLSFGRVRQPATVVGIS